jgi:hypothetical protein
MRYFSLSHAAIGALLLMLSQLAGCSGLPDSEAVASTPEAAVQRAVSQSLEVAVSLAIDTLNLHGDWAFLAGRPLTPEGSPIDYSKTPYAKDVAEGFFDDNFVALVRRTHAGVGGWEVVELSVGATDAPFVDWPDRHGLPRVLITP